MAQKAATRKTRQPALRATAGGRKLVPPPVSHWARSRSIATPASQESGESSLAVPYSDVIGFARVLVRAMPMQRVETERRGLPAQFVKQLALCLGMPANRMLAVLAIPKAAAARKAAKGDLLTGQSAHAALGVIKLLAMVDEMAARSMAPGAERFDVGRWLGEWLERPQPALGGRKAADLLDTPTGVEIVARALGAVESGAYQ